MTALVSSQPAFLLHSDTPSGGILLNSRSPSAPPDSLSTGQSHPPSIASSSSSTSDSRSRSRSSTFGDPSSRKIRFAPLPEPRRDSFPAVFSHDESDSDSPGQFSRPSSASLNVLPTPASPAHSAQSLNELHSGDPTHHEKGVKPKSKKWRQKLLGPLLQPLLPSKDNEDVSQGLSRFSSPHGNGNMADDASKGGAPLGRCMSTGGIKFSKEAERSRTFRDGVPLAPLLPESGNVGIRGRKDGQRMLNGRVYGRRASSADRERKQAALEPEFVEWGYGGMGSVSNDHIRSRGVGPDWAKVQSRGKTFVDTENGDGEGDDGSGMGWVKRRREKREREKRENEERERLHKEHGVPEIEIHPPESKKLVEEVQLPTRIEDDIEMSHKEEEHHRYQAVSVPAPHHHHPRHHPYHKAGETSGSATPTSAPSLSRTNSATSGQQVHQDDAPLNTEATSSESGSSINSLASKSSSESLADEDKDESTERESEDEDEDSDERTRITCRSAGVEKISRHKE